MSGGVCSTPPEVATGDMRVSVHWLRAVTWEPVDALLAKLSGTLNESVVVREGGYHAYSVTYQLGPVMLWHNPDRPDMGSCIEVQGEACEELGRDGLLAIWDAAEWRVSRVDVAADHCPFTPDMVAEAWQRGDVDTRVKVLDPNGKVKPKPGREHWRRCAWESRANGDMFTMGSRSAGQYARCYDERGWTRFELELKKTTAHAAGPIVMEALRVGGSTFSHVVSGLIERFVRFVDRSADSTVTRCPPLDWWAAFVTGVGKARLNLGARVVRTIEEIDRWIVRQVAPTLAVLAEVVGLKGLQRVIQAGRQRWGPRHEDTLRLAGLQV